MPAGSPIGSGQGVLNGNNIRIILEYLKADDPNYPDKYSELGIRIGVNYVMYSITH